MEFKKAIPRKIEIHPTHNGGFVVVSGCGTFCFSDNRSLVAGLSDYLADPEMHEKRYNETQTQSEGGAELTEAPQEQGDSPPRGRTDEVINTSRG